MKVIEEKHNHLDKVHRTVCFNCGSTLEYGNGDITYDLYKKPFIICPVCCAKIPHNPEESAKTKTEPKVPSPSTDASTVQFIKPLNLDIVDPKDDQGFMLRNGQTANFVRKECPRGSWEYIMMIEGHYYRYNWHGVRLEYRYDRWFESSDKDTDIVFYI